MRYIEITSGIKIPLFGEERSLLDKLTKSTVASADLSEREQEVARKMTSRDILCRVRRDGKTFFIPNVDPTLRRF